VIRTFSKRLGWRLVSKQSLRSRLGWWLIYKGQGPATAKSRQQDLWFGYGQASETADGWWPFE
jgi:hypothetical protein